MAEENLLLTEIQDHIGVLTLNRPEKRNALSPQLLVTLHLTLAEWAENDDIRAVVIKGCEGRAFSSGYDVSAIPTDVSPEMAEILKNENPLTLGLHSVKKFPYPVIAMINGYAFGAGLNLAMCCDMRIAAEGIKVGMPPAKLGLVYHPEGLKQFADVLGLATTREVFLSARTYEGAEVLSAGFVHRQVPAENLEAEVFDYARQVAGNAPLSLKGTKEILNMLERTREFWQKDLDRAEVIIKESFASKDLAEGQAAFLEKRKPVFTGK